MTATKPYPEWLTRLLTACTASEQEAIRAYRCHVGRAHHLNRKGVLNHHQVTKAWTRALNRLEEEATGTPSYDRYVKRQYHHFEQFVTGAADSGKPA